MAKRISVRGIQLAYEEHGAGDRPLVLVHGFTGSRRDFRERLPALAALGRTIALDLRGHGESTHAGEYTLDALAEDLVAFLDALAIERCDLLGHSMGGMVALRAALARPQRFASLVLMDTSARAPEGLPRDLFDLAARVAREAGMDRLLELVRRRASEDPLRTEADRRLEAEWGSGYWDDWRIPNFRAMDPEAYAALGRDILEQESLAPRLGAIRCPALVLVGEGDRGFVEAADEMARGIADARHVVIPRGGHSPQLETPEAWHAALRAHLERVRGG